MSVRPSSRVRMPARSREAAATAIGLKVAKLLAKTEVEHELTRHRTGKNPGSSSGAAGEGFAGRIGGRASERPRSEGLGRYLSALRGRILAEQEREECWQDRGVGVCNVRARGCARLSSARAITRCLCDRCHGMPIRRVL